MKNKAEANEQSIDWLKKKSDYFDSTAGLENDIGKMDYMPPKFDRSYIELLEFLPEMIFSIDMQGNFLFTNRLWREYTGYSHDEAKAINMFGLAHPDDQEVIKERVIEVFRGNTIRGFEFKFKIKDGSYINVQTSLSPVIGSEGNVVTVSGIVRDITECKNIEVALQESQEMYRSIVETTAKAGSGIIMLQNVGDIEGAIIFANDEALRITGYVKEELLGKTIQYLFAPDNPPDLMDRYRRRQAGEYLPHYPEISLIRKDGTIVPVEYFTSITTYQGKTASIAHFRDITKLKNVEKALLEARDVYKGILETADKAGEGIVMLQNIGNIEGVIVFANDEALRITGYTKEELIGKAFKDTLLTDNISDLMDRYKRRQAGEEVPGYSELWVLRKDGTTVPIECSAGITTYQNKVATIAYIRDINERKQAEETLKESQDLYRSMVETASMAGEGIGIVQTIREIGPVVVFANDALLRIAGYSREELIGRSFQTILTLDNLSELMDRYHRRQAGEALPTRHELSIVRKDGTTVPVEYDVGITTYHGNVASIFYVRDITERKQAEETLLESRDMYRSMVETADRAGIGIGIVQNVGNQEGTLVFVNEEVLRITGYRRKELIGRPFQDILFTDNLSEFMHRYRTRQAGEALPGYSELKILRKDGTTVSIECSAGMTTYKNKVATIAYIRDKTKSKQAEEALQQSREYFKALIENAYDVTMIVDIDGHINYVTPSIKQSQGYEVEEFMSQNPFDLIHPNSLQNAIDDFTEIIQTPNIFKYSELQVRHKNGSWRKVEATSNNLLNLPSVAGIVINFRDITERKQAEDALRESEQRFKDIFDNALDGICLADMETHQFYTSNNVFCQMLGYTPEDIRKMKVEDIHPKTRLPYVLEQFTKQAKEEITLASDMPMLRRDGSIFYVDINASPLVIDGKRYIMGIFRDITERKSMEEKYKQLLEDIYDGYAVLQDGKYAFTNRRFCEILGYESGEMLGKHFSDILLPDERQSMMEIFEKVMCGEEEPVDNFEQEVMKADGTTVIIEARTKPIQFDGKLAYSIIIRDITELKEAKDELKHSEEYFRSLIENTSDVIDVLGIDGKVRYISPSVEHVLGYKPEEMIGNTTFELIHPDDLSVAMVHFTRIIETPKYNDHLEIRVRHKDGSWRTVQAIGKNLLNHPPVAGIVVNFRDVTESKRMEKKYRQLLEDMKDGYAVVQDGNVVFANKRLSEIFGYELQEAVGQNMRKFVAPYDLQKVMELYTRMVNGMIDTNERQEFKGIKKDGTIFSIQGGAKLIEYDGKPAYSIIVRDITSKKNIEDMLQKSQKKLQSIIHALPDILSHVSSDGTFLDEPMGYYHINEQVNEQFPVTFSMKKLSDVFLGEFSDIALKAIKTALDNNLPQVVEHKLPFPIETEIEDVFETRIIPFGKNEVLAISRNITDQKQSEKRLHTYQKQLRSLTAQLSQAEELERRRLAIDLHDLIGQSLAVIKIKLNEWKDTLQSSGHANAMREVLKILENAISNTRSLTFDLSPPVLYELGLEAGLESLLEQFHERHSIKYKFEDDNQDKPIEDEVRILLYRCVSELLMNVIKHSKAQLVKLTIRRENNQISISLEDDGVGFSVQEAEIGGDLQGFGLLSIRERLNWIGGSFELQSNPGLGTYATLQAPLKYAKNIKERQI